MEWGGYKDEKQFGETEEIENSRDDNNTTWGGNKRFRRRRVLRILAIPNKGRKVQELRKETVSIEYGISTFAENTDEWQVAKLNLEEKQEELSKQIELSVGFGELGEIMNNSAGDKFWNANQESIRRESVESQSRAIQEDRGDDFGAVISGDLWNSGGRIALPEQQETDIGENVLGSVELGGAK